MVSILVFLLLFSVASAQQIAVELVDSSYWIATSWKRGGYSTGQNADIMLSGVDFNNAGGPLLFNHPGGIASDGKRLILADRQNNRVLIWNEAPTGNVKPDLVLGQKDFNSNSNGNGLHELNWAIGVAIGGGKLVVADTYNDRILVWNSIPTETGKAADFAVKTGVAWPWGVWTDGQKLVVTSTGANPGKVLIWNSFPAGDIAADITISLPGKFGTPRTVGTDGKHLMIGDENAFGNKKGNFFWRTFPTENNQTYDFYIGDGQTPRNVVNEILWGPIITPDGKIVTIGGQLYFWNTFPVDQNDAPDLAVGSPSPGLPGYAFGGDQSGDGSGVTMVGDRLYVSLQNGNKIVGFNSLPTRSDQNPDFVIGAPDIHSNTLHTNYFITNPEPLTDGKSVLVVSSLFDRKISYWNNIPDQSGAKPDVVYSFVEKGPGADSDWHGDVFATAVGKSVYVWNGVPPLAEKPHLVFEEKIGNINFVDLRGVAIDNKFFYLADSGANKVYVWDGVPKADSNPTHVIDVEGPRRLSSDGTYLAVTQTFRRPPSISLYQISGFPEKKAPITIPRPGIRTGFGDEHLTLNLPADARVAGGYLFVADTINNRVLAWRIQDAIDGKPPVVLGQSEARNSLRPAIGKNKLFWPATLAFDGTYLWVGEVKFSNRVVRFSGELLPGAESFTLTVDRSAFPIFVKSTGTVSSLTFNIEKKIVRVNYSDVSQGTMVVTFPNRMLNGTITVLLDGITQQSALSTNATHTTVSSGYPVGNHVLEIVGTLAIPEFHGSLQAVLTLAVSLVLISLIIRWRGGFVMTRGRQRNSRIFFFRTKCIGLRRY